MSLSAGVALPTDSDADRSADSQGGATGLPQAVARADSHPAGVGQGSRRPAATPGAANLLPRHQDPGVQAPGAGPTALPGREFNPRHSFFFPLLRSFGTVFFFSFLSRPLYSL